MSVIGSAILKKSLMIKGTWCVMEKY